jgi:cell division protein FtsZ
VGGGGGNAVNRMIQARMEGVEFIAANTDVQALKLSHAPVKLQLGVRLTSGLGAGANPDVGRRAALEDSGKIIEAIEGADMCFVTAGLGGGTGTGAAPVIARMARERGILTVGVVTKPFQFEGSRRMRLAEQGLNELQDSVDTLIVIPNQNLFRIANEKTTFADAFAMADRVLHSGVRGITDLMVMPGLINLDFADVKTVMMEMGKAMMGTGESEGDSRALEAAESAIANPLLDDVSLKGAKGVLINITGGMDMTLFEVDEAANRIRSEVDPDANIIVGSTFDDTLNGSLRVSVFATGIDTDVAAMDVAPAMPSYTPRPAAPEPVAAAPEAPAVVAVEESAPFGEVIEIHQPRQEESPVEMALPETAPQAESMAPEITEVAEMPAPAVEEPAPAAPQVEFDQPFVASRPMSVEQREVLERANSFSDVVAARTEKDVSARRGPSLFDRLTGRVSRPAGAQARREPDFAKPQPAATMREDSARTMQPQRHSEPAAPRDGGLNLGQAPKPQEDEMDDQLEIPAFLRRQAN